MTCYLPSFHTGKPVAVTHSRGKGLTRSIPGSDYVFERSNWGNKKVGIEKPSVNESFTNTKTGSDGQEEDFMALTLESHAEVDILASADMPGKHSFHSMAEVASCSYEARKVMAIYSVCHLFFLLKKIRPITVLV